jgi:hypothetical protein
MYLFFTLIVMMLFHIQRQQFFKLENSKIFNDWDLGHTGQGTVQPF